jgi:membrane protease YdiL (CAAX protease family)
MIVSGWEFAAAESAGSGASVTAPEYPHLLRRADSRWWRPFLGLATLACCWEILYAVLAGIVPAIGQANLTESSSPIDVVATGLTLALGLPAALAAVVLGHRARAGVLLSVTGRPRLGLFVVATAIASVALVPMMLTKTASFPNGSPDGGGWVGWQTFAPLLAAIVSTFPFQSAAEEFVFRGYLTQAITTCTRRAWPAAVVSSLLFVGAHSTHDGWIFADRFFFALALCWLTWRTGGLEAAIAIHVAYNLLLGLGAAATGRMNSMIHASRSDAPGTLTSIGGTLLAVTVIVWWTDRREPAVQAPPQIQQVAA